MNLPWTYVGRVNCVTGYGEAARHQLHVLRKAGMRFRVQDAGSAASPDPSGRDLFIKAARASDEGIEATAGTIIHVSPNCAEEFRIKFPGPHVLVSVWETTRLPRQWVPLINKYDQVWCATKWQMDTYRESGVDPSKLRHVTFALDPDLYPLEGRAHAYTQRLHHPQDPYFVFGSIFQWTARKAPDLLISAFTKAFQKGEKAVLLLKTYEGDNPARPEVRAELNRTRGRLRAPAVLSGEGRPFSPARIELVTEHMTRDKVISLLRGVDAYVSMHRGEGWGLPLHEATLLGKPVIAPGFSAPGEYLGPSLAPVRSFLEPPTGMNWQPFYTYDQDWAAPSVEDCARWMRSLYEWHEATGELFFDVHKERERLGLLVEQAGLQAAAALSELV